jgi:hypothetical protein
MSRKSLVILAAALSLVGSAQNPASSQYNISKWAHWENPRVRKVDESFQDEHRTLIQQVAYHPELMSLDYLYFYIGRPDNEKTQLSRNKHYIWYEGGREPRYELEQQEIAPGKVIESKMTFHLPAETKLTFDQLDAIFGPMSRRFFDYSGHPAKLFSFAPNTYLAFSSHPNSLRLSKARIIYRGGVLPPPGDKEMQLGKTLMQAKALAAMPKDDDKGPVTDEAVHLLRANALSRPQDPDAHYKLARALIRRCDLHHGIAEYKIALSLSGTSPEVREKTLIALRDLRVLNDIDPDAQRRNLEIVQHGQRIKVRGHEKESTKNDPLPESVDPF